MQFGFAPFLQWNFIYNFAHIKVVRSHQRGHLEILKLKNISWAPSTLRRGNLKTAFSPRQCIKCFPFTLRRRNLKTQQSPVLLDLCSREIEAGKSQDYYREVNIFVKLLFQNVFHPHVNAKPAFWNSFLLFEVRAEHFDLRNSEGRDRNFWLILSFEAWEKRLWSFFFFSRNHCSSS